MTSPSAETIEPDPPVLKRTHDFCRCSSHCGVASKPYLSFSSFVGALLNSHIPSSAAAVAADRNSRVERSTVDLAIMTNSPARPSPQKGRSGYPTPPEPATLPASVRGRPALLPSASPHGTDCG